jgi:hypothetical protein
MKKREKSLMRAGEENAAGTLGAASKEKVLSD